MNDISSSQIMNIFHNLFHLNNRKSWQLLCCYGKCFIQIIYGTNHIWQFSCEL